MEIIIMKSGSFQAIMDKIEAIEKHICHSHTESKKPPLQEIWLDNEAVCAYLKISQSTLQRYRSSGELPFQMIYHKTYYKESDVIRFIEKHFSSFRNMNKKGNK